MLKETSGTGDSVRDVNEDMVIARGTPSCVAVHITTGFVSSRNTERTCSERVASASGSDVGTLKGESFHDCEEAEDCRFLDMETSEKGGISFAKTRTILKIINKKAHA